jgi:hypothetical protein
MARLSSHRTRHISAGVSEYISRLVDFKKQSRVCSKVRIFKELGNKDTCGQSFAVNPSSHRWTQAMLTLGVKLCDLERLCSVKIFTTFAAS